MRRARRAASQSRAAGAMSAVAACCIRSRGRTVRSLLSLPGCSAARCAAAAEVIHISIRTSQVAKDGELTVTETLRVRAEGRAIRRGIYRDFPLTFVDAAAACTR